MKTLQQKGTPIVQMVVPLQLHKPHMQLRVPMTHMLVQVVIKQTMMEKSEREEDSVVEDKGDGLEVKPIKENTK